MTDQARLPALDRPTVAARRRPRLRLRGIVQKVHLVLGLASGVIVFGVALSGAIYVFEEEIRSLYQESYTRVPPRDQGSRLPASELARRGEIALTGALGVVESLSTGLGLSLDPTHAATFWGHREKPNLYYQVYLDPYTGVVLRVQNQDWDPIELVRSFHQSLLLPYDIGHQIVGWSVVVFLAMLVTGLVLWWPRRSARQHPGAVRAKFTIRWQARFRRVNYDLHSVLGFYVLIVGLIIAVTGLVWSFTWVDNAIYWIATGGRTKAEPAAPKSAPPPAAWTASSRARVLDQVLAEAARRLPAADRFSVELPKEATGALVVWGVVVGQGSESGSYRWSGALLRSPRRDASQDRAVRGAGSRREAAAHELLHPRREDPGTSRPDPRPGGVPGGGQPARHGIPPLVEPRAAHPGRARHRALRQDPGRFRRRCRSDLLEPSPAIAGRSGLLPEGYAVPEATIGTRTDAPILPIPCSIQVVPRARYDAK